MSVFEVGECECGWLVLWGAGFVVFYLKLNFGEYFEVDECECGWLVLWSAGFSVFKLKWKMDSVFELGECLNWVSVCV